MKVHSDITGIRIEDYSYDLPAERIASRPVAQRDDSRLLVSLDDRIEETRFGNIAGYLQPGSLMVLNNTRVVQARLEFFKETGARIEIFCLQPLQPVQDVQLALAHQGSVTWQCMVGNAKKWKAGDLVIADSQGDFTLTARMVESNDQGYEVLFSWQPAHLSFGEVLEKAGKTPLPPYITRQAEYTDRTTYQTVYACHQGSVAAPTAGLHFTPAVFGKLEEKKIPTAFVTLHVGAGTFKPVSSETIGDHQMHQEQFVVQKALIETLVEHQGPVVSVGTTSMRTLESLYWLGAKLLHGYQPRENNVKVEQWDPYNGTLQPDAKQAFQAILLWMEQQELSLVQGETGLIIVPGYHFKVVDVLVTNFHQPRSTLLLLVAAFAGPRWKKAYQYALDNGMRFLSYGDSSLYFRNNNPH